MHSLIMHLHPTNPLKNISDVKCVFSVERHIDYKGTTSQRSALLT